MKAISLMSGGLDSQLAVALIKEQGIEVIALTMKTPFFGDENTTRKAAENLGIEYQMLDISDKYMNVLKNPVYGYGKNMNPCIDCHAFMLKTAGEYMQQIGASFLITGEVLGQRPMSQNKSSLRAVEKQSSLKGYVLRPLSAKLLEPTIPETEGWVDREKLLDISGRSRTIQMDLAEKYNIKEYPSPAGGCLLTQENFSRRLRKVLDLKPEAGPDEMEILKYGRHFYIGNNKLLVVGRNQSDNKNLQNLASQDDILFKVTDRPGPLSLLRPITATATEDDIKVAAAITARYSDAKNEETATIRLFDYQNNNARILEVSPMKAEEVPASV